MSLKTTLIELNQQITEKYTSTMRLILIKATTLINSKGYYIFHLALIQLNSNFVQQMQIENNIRVQYTY